MEIVKYRFQQHGDERGQLVALEENKDIPFQVKRVYYMYDTVKGFKDRILDVIIVLFKCLKQILIAIHGNCKIHLDNGKETAEILLDKPYEGLYISNDMWREMYDFSEDAVLMVLASEYYDESDYIRNYDEYIQYIKNEVKE